jgi:HD-like signal output (HDOD) protein
MTDSTRLAVADVLKGIDIPPCPAVLTALQREMAQTTRDAGRISRLLSQDVALAAGVMKIANSEYFAPARQIESISDALAFLGLGAVFNLVVNELLHRAVRIDRSLKLDRFWDSAAYSAGVCSELARALPGVDRGNAYCFGLFHDCGLPIMMRRFADYKDTLALANRDRRHQFTRVEEDRHGTHHGAIGCLLARNWGLPDTVSRAILCHHDYSVFEDSQGLAHESLTLIAINLISDRVIDLYLREAREAEWDKGRAIVGTFLDMSQTDLARLVDDMRYRLESRQAA